MNEETDDLVSKVMPEEGGPPIQKKKDPTGKTLELDRPSQPGASEQRRPRRKP